MYELFCIVSGGCGEVSNENMTYFEVENPMMGTCAYTICPTTKNICQIRLDFVVFTINGPSTDPTSSYQLLNGLPINLDEPNAVAASQSTRCNEDRFTVTNPTGTNPPSICGENSGQHSKLFFRES